MKFVSFRSSEAGRYSIGRINDDASITDLTEATGSSSLSAAEINNCLDLDGELWTRVAAADGPTVDPANVRLAAPVPRPGKVICIGLNYRDHAEESGMEIPKRPLIFSKFSSSVIGPDEAIKLPPTSSEVDYEAEMAVVIGRRTAEVSAADALECVFGYCNFNDVSARDLQFADGHWQRGKSCDTFAPLGPFIATRDEVPDAGGLDIRFRLNGEVLQDSNTRQLIFNVAEIVSFLSKHVTLEPGDVIATGTPPGVGFARKPPIYLKRGDVCEVEVEGLGVLKNPVA